MKAVPFRLKRPGVALLAALAFSGVAMGSPPTFQSEYSYVGANEYRSLDYYVNISPGKSPDSGRAGRRIETVAANEHYFAAGSHFEGIVLYSGNGLPVNINSGNLLRSTTATARFANAALREASLDKSDAALVSGTGTVLVGGREINPVTGGIGFEGALLVDKSTRLRGSVEYFAGRDYQTTQLYLRYELLF